MLTDTLRGILFCVKIMKEIDYIITIITVNFNTSDFIALILTALNKLSYFPYKVIICDNGSANKDVKRLVYICRNYDNVKLIFRKQTSCGSIGHAEALDLLVSEVETSYFVAMDSDAIMLQKNWDKLMIEQINNKVKIIGTPPEPTQNIKPHKYPLPYLALYETKTFKKINQSFMPTKLKDTAEILKDKYIEFGYLQKIFYVRSARQNNNLRYLPIICNEYYLNEEDMKNKIIFASHFGRGATLGAAKYLKKINVPVIAKLLKKFIGYKEKRKWINISYQIIESNK